MNDTKRWNLWLWVIWILKVGHTMDLFSHILTKFEPVRNSESIIHNVFDADFQICPQCSLILKDRSISFYMLAKSSKNCFTISDKTNDYRSFKIYHTPLHSVIPTWIGIGHNLTLIWNFFSHQFIIKNMYLFTKKEKNTCKIWSSSNG